MKKRIPFLLLVLTVISFYSCQLEGNRQSSKISGEDLLNNNARSSTLDFKSIPTIKLFDASTIELDLEDLEQIDLSLEAFNVAKQQARIKTIRNNIEENRKEKASPKVELMLSDEPLKEGLALIAIESAQNQVLTLELYDKRGNLFVSKQELQLKEGTNYKMLYSKDVEAEQYLLLLKDEDGEELMRKLYFEL